MARLFIAVRPPDDVVEVLRALPRKDQRGVRFVPPDRWHVTLRFLEDADPDAVIEAIGRTALPSATACVGPSIDLLGTHSVVAPMDGLQELAGVVTAATAGLGDTDDRRSFVGHLTLARVRRGAVVRKIVGMDCRCEFDVDEVELVESRLRPDGARHTVLATWPTYGATP